jgi:hypothetical protein
VLDGIWGAMPYYPSAKIPGGWTESENMLARWAEAPKHRLVYFVIADGDNRLVNEYFPNTVQLTTDERKILSSSVPNVPIQLLI